MLKFSFLSFLYTQIMGLVLNIAFGIALGYIILFLLLWLIGAIIAILFGSNITQWFNSLRSGSSVTY